jgi:hypothetical protein
LKAIEEINTLNLEKEIDEESGALSPIKRNSNPLLKEASMKNVARTEKTKKLPINKPKGKYSKGILTPAELERLF